MVAVAVMTGCVHYTADSEPNVFEDDTRANRAGSSSGSVPTSGGSAGCLAGDCTTDGASSSGGSSSSSSSSGGSVNCSALNPRTLVGGITFSQTGAALTILGGDGADNMAIGGNNTSKQVVLTDNSGQPDVTFRCVETIVIQGGGGVDRVVVGRPTGTFVDVQSLHLVSVENFSTAAGSNIPRITM